MSDPVLQARKLSKSFGPLRALDAVDLEVGAGEFIGLVGPNGAGKTTLLSIASGLVTPDAGTIALFGVGYRRDRALILGQIGVVFQSRALDLEISARAALKFHGALYGLSGRALASRIEEIAAMLDIEDLLGRRIGTLSGGNIRRIEIARSLLNTPRLVLMDEASTGLDPAIRARLMTHVRTLCRDLGVAVLWATHLLDEVVDANRVVVMHKGRLTPLELPDRENASLLETYDKMVSQTDVAGPADLSTERTMGHRND
jgi:ABC-2 type transport system ATP-binding protein